MTKEITAEKALDRLRARISYTTNQTDLANEFGVTPQHVCNVLSGRTAPSEAMLASVGVARKKIYVCTLGKGKDKPSATLGKDE